MVKEVQHCFPIILGNVNQNVTSASWDTLMNMGRDTSCSVPPFFVQLPTPLPSIIGFMLIKVFLFAFMDFCLLWGAPLATEIE